MVFPARHVLAPQAQNLKEKVGLSAAGATQLYIPPYPAHIILQLIWTPLLNLTLPPYLTSLLVFRHFILCCARAHCKSCPYEREGSSPLRNFSAACGGPHRWFCPYEGDPPNFSGACGAPWVSDQGHVLAKGE